MEIRDYIYAYFKGSVKGLYHTSNGWYRFDNPFGRKKDKSSAVNFEFCCVLDWRSGIRMSALEYIMELEGLSSITEVFKFLDIEISPVSPPLIIETTVSSEDYRIPKEFLHIYEGQTIFKEKAQTYLFDRGFDLDFCIKMGIMYAEEGRYYGRIILPFINQKGLWDTFNARDFLNPSVQEYKYLNPKNGEVPVKLTDTLYNEYCLKTALKVYITEGVFDSMTFIQKGFDSIAASGWAIGLNRKRILLNSPIKELVVIADRGFYNKTMNQFSFLLNTDKKVKIINMDNEKVKDANEGGLDLIFELEEKTTYLSYESLFA